MLNTLIVQTHEFVNNQPVYRVVVFDMKPAIIVHGDRQTVKVIERYGVHIAGSVGPAGPPGESATPGESIDLAYRHVQDSPSDEWTITHNLEKFPSVTVVDTDNPPRRVFPDIRYPDENTVIVYFAVPFTGQAFLN